MDLLIGIELAAMARGKIDTKRLRWIERVDGGAGVVVASNRRKLASYIGEYLYFTKSDHPDGKVMWAIITCWNTKSRKSKLYIRKSMRIIRDESFR